ncbi:MAG: DUF445 family protein [Negativicutes bacterium]|nr:DUF445 family protein [Negativicutes bacterium]
MNFFLGLKATYGWWLPPLIGAAIGLITNWLAIRMLFRPYRAYYIGKLKIPFTPGVIPSRRTEISGKVGQVVAQYLFNETELSRTFLEPSVQDGIVNFLTLRWQSLMTSDATGETWLQQLPEERKRQLKQQIAEQLIRRLAEAIKREATQEQGKRLLQEQWRKVLQQSPPPRFFTSGSSCLSDFLENWLQQDHLRETVKAALTERFQLLRLQWQNDQTTLADLLGDDTSRELIRLLFDHRANLALLLKAILSDAELSKELAPLVKRQLEKQWPLNILGALISEEHMLKIITSLLADAEVWLDQDENQAMLAERLTGAFRDFAQKPLTERLLRQDSLLTEERLQTAIDSLWQGLRNTVDRKAINLWLTGSLVSLQGCSWQQLAERFGAQDRLENVPALLWQILEREIESEERQQQIGLFLQEQIDLLLQKPFREFLNGWQPQQSQWQKAAQWLQQSAVKILPELLPALNVNRMVERRLNEFPLAEIEQLIIHIAGKELSAITWFGALLGFLIGSLQLVI